MHAGTRRCVGTPPPATSPACAATGSGSPPPTRALRWKERLGEDDLGSKDSAASVEPRPLGAPVARVWPSLATVPHGPARTPSLRGSPPHSSSRCLPKAWPWRLRCVCRRVGGWNSHAALNTPGGARGSQGVGAAEGAEQRRRPSPGRFSSWGRSGRADAPSAEVGGAEKHLSPVGTQEGLRVTRGFAQRLQPLSDLRDNGGFTSTRPWTLLPGLEFRHRQALEVAEPSAGSGARGPDSAIEARPAA